MNAEESGPEMETLAEADKLGVACMRGQKGLGFGFVESGGGWKCHKVQKNGIKNPFCPKLARMYWYMLVVYRYTLATAPFCITCTGTC